MASSSLFSACCGVSPRLVHPGNMGQTAVYPPCSFWMIRMHSFMPWLWARLLWRPLGILRAGRSHAPVQSADATADSALPGRMERLYSAPLDGLEPTHPEDRYRSGPAPTQSQTAPPPGPTWAKIIASPSGPCKPPRAPPALPGSPRRRLRTRRDEYLPTPTQVAEAMPSVSFLEIFAFFPDSRSPGPWRRSRRGVGAADEGGYTTAQAQWRGWMPRAAAREWYVRNACIRIHM